MARRMLVQKVNTGLRGVLLKALDSGAENCCLKTTGTEEGWWPEADAEKIGMDARSTGAERKTIRRTGTELAIVVIRISDDMRMETEKLTAGCLS